jgi:hypothetical protein
MWMSLLPGLRELRTPLASGVLWLAALYVALGDRATRVLEVIDRRLEGLSTVGLDLETGARLTALSFAAYLIGTAWEGIAPWFGVPLYSLVAKLFRSPDPGPTVLGRPWCRPRGMTMVGALILQSLRSHPDRGGEPDEQFRNKLDMHKYESELLDELALLPARIVGKEPELWGNWDRLQSEGTFRLTVAVPLGALGTALIWTTLGGRPAWLATFGCVAFSCLLASLGASKRWDAAELLLQAVQSKRVEQLEVSEVFASRRIDWKSDEEPADRAVEGDRSAATVDRPEEAVAPSVSG